MDFLLALTIGLLLFLLVDGAQEGFEAAALLPESFQGGVLFVLGGGRRLSAARSGSARG